MQSRLWASRRRGWGSLGACALLGAALLLALTIRHAKIFRLEWMIPLLWLVPPLALAEILRRRCRPECLPQDDERPPAGLLVLFGFCLLGLFSNVASFKWFYFLDWAPAGAALWDANSGISRFVLLTALAWPLFLFPAPRRSNGLLLAVLIGSQAAALFLLLKATQGMPLYNDDHPSFWYRLWIFGRCFPRLLNYSPAWNAGNLELAGLSTGAVAPGLVLWPLWARGGIPGFYTAAVGILYALAVPLLAVASARIAGMSRTAGWAAGLLALGTSRYQFLWWLHYGTIGANFTSAFILPALACQYRVLTLNRREWATGLGLALSLLFLWMWPPGLVTTLALAAAAVMQGRYWTRGKVLFLAGWTAAAGLLFLYPLACLLQGTDLLRHDWTGGCRVPGGFGRAFREGLEVLRQRAREAHPCLVTLGFGGLLAASGKPLRAGWLPAAAVLAFLAGWGRFVVPVMQPERMAVPLLYVLIVPAAAGLASLLDTRSLRLAAVRAAVFALLVLSGWNAARLFGGAGEAGFAFRPPAIRQLAERVQRETAPGDRIMLAGGTGHAYEGGHVTAFPLLFRREVLSSEYRHDQIREMRYGCPPSAPPPDPVGLDRYIELFAPRLILTPHENWKQFLRADPGRFEERAGVAGEDSDVAVFRVRRPASRFAQGSGQIVSHMNALDVWLEDPQAPAVIKYNWVDGLQSPDADLEPADVGDGVRLIRIRPRAGPGLSSGLRTRRIGVQPPSLVRIRFRRWW